MNFRLVFILLATPVLAMAQMIDFEKPDWKSAMEKARKEKKFLMVYLNTPSCEPCLDMEESIFNDSDVNSYYSKSFINVPFDAEQFPGAEIANRYDAYLYPSFLFINGDGELIHKGCGWMDAASFVTLGKDALTKERQLLTYKRRFAEGERSPAFLAEYSAVLVGSCGDMDAFVKEFYRDLPQDQWIEEASWTMINLNVYDPFSPQFEFLTTYHDKFAMRYGRDTVDAKINEVILGQFIDIYEGADLTLFANQALQRLIGELSFKGKGELESMLKMQYAELTGDWTLYGSSVVKVVKEQEVTDADQLVEFGWKFYLYVDNSEHLAAAVTWMEGVLNREPSPASMDTYASLLYKTGNKKEALKMEKEALKMAKEALEDPTHYELQLAKFELGMK